MGRIKGQVHVKIPPIATKYNVALAVLLYRRPKAAKLLGITPYTLKMLLTNKADYAEINHDLDLDKEEQKVLKEKKQPLIKKPRKTTLDEATPDESDYKKLKIPNRKIMV